jgi:hypothetical protein
MLLLAGHHYQANQKSTAACQELHVGGTAAGLFCKGKKTFFKDRGIVCTYIKANTLLANGVYDLRYVPQHIIDEHE